MLQARLPAFVARSYECHAWNHASAILSQDFPGEGQDLPTDFQPRRSWIVAGGGAGCPLLVFGIRKSPYVEDEA